MPSFEPLFRNPHWQTLAAHFWPRPAGSRCAVERRWFGGALLESQRPVEAAAEVVLLPGLAGSGRSGYMRSLAGAALHAGFAAHRLNPRPVYHAGLTEDLLHVLEALRDEGRPAAFVVGFSLGANVALKLAGELGERAGDLISGVCGVSPAIDLQACARRIHQRDNWLYEQRLLRSLRGRVAGAAETRATRTRSIFEFDDRITAPHFGFGSAGNYYQTQSALRYLDAVRVPVLVVQAKDDTFVPFETFESEAIRSHPEIELMAVPHGGHLGFLSRTRSARFWADKVVVEWISERVRRPEAVEAFPR